MPHRSNASLLASVADVATCRASLRGGSKTFFAASLALPRRVRQPAAALYAFCRMADDAIDHGTESPSGAARSAPAARSDLRRRSPRNRGRPRLCRLRAAVRDPQAISACAARGVRVGRDRPSLRGLVGAQVLWSAGCRHGGRHDGHGHERPRPRTVARCLRSRRCHAVHQHRPRRGRRCAQRPVVSPAPVDARGRAGSGCVAGRARCSAARWRASIERLLAEARCCTSAATRALRGCRRPAGPGMYAARLLYAEIGREVARHGYDSVSQRAVVPRRRKGRILADAWVAAKRRSPATALGEMPEAAFLLDAFVLRTTGGAGSAGHGPRTGALAADRGSSGVAGHFVRSFGTPRSGCRRGRQPVLDRGSAHASARGMRNGSRHCTQRARNRSRSRLS